MKNFDYLTKELIDSVSFTTISQDREAYTNVNINGRDYAMFGTLQAITFVGLIYEDAFNNKIMHVGISKQHPNDSKCDKKLAYEMATLKAMENPDIVFNTVPENITMFNFRQMMSGYYDAMDVQFIRTKKEIELLGEDPKKYNR